MAASTFTPDSSGVTSPLPQVTNEQMGPIPGARKSGPTAQPPEDDATTAHIGSRPRPTISLNRAVHRRLVTEAHARGLTANALVDLACSEERLAQIALHDAADEADSRRGQVTPAAPDPAIAAAFGAALRRWRIATGRDQGALATEIRSSRTKICRVETGHGAFRRPTMRLLTRLGFRAGEWMR